MATIVVGWDASPQARSALAAAARLAPDGRLVVVHVREARRDHPTARWQELSEMEADERSRALLAEAKAPAGAQLELRSADGDPAEALIEVAGEVGADAIAVGTRGLGGASAFVGSVSETLLREARTPVLVIPPST